MKKLLLSAVVALTLVPVANASLGTRVSRLEAKTRSLQAQVNTLKSNQVFLSNSLICISALNSDLSMISFDAIDILFGSPGPFIGSTGFDDKGACAAIGVNRTPYVVTHALNVPPSPKGSLLAAGKVMQRVSLFFAFHHAQR